MSQDVRVRFAPSPTGALHIGGVRTALYNYLFARKHGGTFILRIEDTDQVRYVEGAEQYIMDTLHWLGLQADESPEVGGSYAPYRQSERKDIYLQYAQQLVDAGKAYYAFDTAEELETMRQRLEEAKAKNLSYNAITRRQMRNSLILPPHEVKSLIENGTPYVIRVKIPPKEEIRVQDMVMGWVKAHSSTLDDKVLIKSDGLPTYHLANVVDDHLMKISHVIRGKEWLPSTYLHVLLYQYLGWEKEMPQFAHLPLILKPSGKGKLSKRDGIKFGFPVFPLEWEDTDEKTGEKVKVMGFREEGYLPEALLNFLAFLGWNPGTEQEMFSLEELIQTFSFQEVEDDKVKERVGKSDAIFDVEKAKWFNQQYLKEKSNQELASQLLQTKAPEGLDTSQLNQAQAEKIIDLMKVRISFLPEIWEEASYLFQAPESYDEKTVRKKWTEESTAFLQEFHQQLQDSPSEWKADLIKEELNLLLEKKELKLGKVMPSLRVAITGMGGGPDLMSVMEIVGRQATLERIEKAIERLA